MTVRKAKSKHNPFHVSPATNIDFVVGAEVGNVINVGLQLKNGSDELAQRVSLFAYLSSDANGDSLATAPTTVAVGTDGLLIPLVTGRAFQLTCEADGDIDLNITLSSGAATYYLVVVLPDGTLEVSGAITFAA